MAPVTNKRALFNEIPKGYPDAEKTFKVDDSQKFDVDTVELNGGVAVKVLVLSIDPYLRARMREPDTGSYSSAFALGEPIQSHGVAVVLKSEDASVSPGEHLYGFFPYVEYAVLPDATKYRKVSKAGNHPWSIYVGVSGMPGQTAYYGYNEHFQPYAKKGDTLFVTTGAGPVGSFVIQLAKEQGLKVIASAGSEGKVKFMQECGADVAFNYKTTNIKEVLAQHGPINFYWDHVGGESLDAALEASAPSARFIIVGLIAGYNSEHVPLKNYPHILFKSINIQGFLVSSLDAKYSKEFYEEVPSKVASGELKYLEYKKHGFEKAGELLLDVLTGKNTGKAILTIADE